MMLSGPIPATRKVFAQTGLTMNDMDLYEVNEAFAPVPLAWAKELGADLDKLNVNGGAMAGSSTGWDWRQTQDDPAP